MCVCVSVYMHKALYHICMQESSQGALCMLVFQKRRSTICTYHIYAPTPTPTHTPHTHAHSAVQTCPLPCTCLAYVNAIRMCMFVCLYLCARTHLQ